MDMFSPKPKIAPPRFLPQGSVWSLIPTSTTQYLITETLKVGAVQSTKDKELVYLNPHIRNPGINIDHIFKYRPADEQMKESLTAIHQWSSKGKTTTTWCMVLNPSEIPSGPYTGLQFINPTEEDKNIAEIYRLTGNLPEEAITCTLQLKQ